MNINLTDGMYVTGDALNYELHDGSVSYFFRTISEVVDKYSELIRKDRTKKFNGNIEEYLAEIKRVNKQTTDAILKELNDRGVIKNEEFYTQKV